MFGAKLNFRGTWPEKRCQGKASVGVIGRFGPFPVLAVVNRRRKHLADLGHLEQKTTQWATLIILGDPDGHLER